ncbi:MAG TPA: preprotein translocase subunit SecG [bacterium]|nr:preprotein translocase subunit SecG [bacterium]
MVAFLTVIHVLVCILLVITILLQSSKGGGMAGMFGGGGGGMGAVFGGRGAASFLSKVTLWLGVTFGLTSVSIALLSAGSMQRQTSAVQQVLEDEGTMPSDILPTVPGGTVE